LKMERNGKQFLTLNRKKLISLGTLTISIILFNDKVYQVVVRQPSHFNIP
jgi:hypothetical protein